MQHIADLSLLTSIAIPLVTGMAMGLAFGPDRVLTTKIPFYSKLIKSPFSPPNYIFAPVWTFIYIAMGYVYFRLQTIHNNSTDEELRHLCTLAIQLYWVQLIVNLLFTPLNFGLKSLSLAFVDIILLLTLVITLIVTVSFIDLTSTLLLLPYLAWGIYATYLQWYVWKHNTGGPESQPILH